MITDPNQWHTTPEGRKFRVDPADGRLIGGSGWYRVVESPETPSWIGYYVKMLNLSGWIFPPCDPPEGFAQESAPEPSGPCYYCQHPPGSHAPACIEVKYGHAAEKGTK